jgi:putative PIN family toxin of toxin-antitoxin system
MTHAADRPRVVFDCNVLVQAAGNGDGPSGVALRLLEENRIEVFVSRAVLRELRAVLNYPSVRQKLRKLDDDRVEAFVQRLAFRATLLRSVPHVFDYPRAHQDEGYVDLAVASDADYLVTRDKDLLSLATDHSVVGKQFRQLLPRLHVVNPVEFLRELGALA